MNMQEIIKRLSALSADEDRCKYCNSSTISGGDIYCSAGYSHDMNCGGKKFKLDRIREIIISEQKEPATDNNVVTIGDKIRESNESLANEIMKFGQRCYDCDYKEKPECNVKSCKDGILEYLNQPYTDTIN